VTRRFDEGVTELRFVYAGFDRNAVDYLLAWQQQRELHAQRVDDVISDTVMLLEHPSVYTAGKRTDGADRPADGTPVVEVDRGGKITWHGPGQLVGYPIMKLPDDVYVVDYVRRLEEALIEVCTDFGLATGRVKGRSGVWLSANAAASERKIAAVGVRVSRGVTMHGFALNCDCTLDSFDAIVPCGITDAGVTSLSAELGRPVSVAAARPVVEEHLRELLSWRAYTRSADFQATDPDPDLDLNHTSPVGSAAEEQALRHVRRGGDLRTSTAPLA